MKGQWQKRAGAILLSLFLFIQICAQPISINEFCANNIRSESDEFENHKVRKKDRYDDWVELYNGSDKEIDLSGYSLSDDPSRPSKWIFPPESFISPHGFLLIWLDAQPKQGDLHANFKLNKSGEFLSLSNPDEIICDSLSFGRMGADVSMGKEQEGKSTWKYFRPASPGASNSAYTGFKGQSGVPVLSPSAGRYSHPVSLSLESPKGTLWYTTDGSPPGPENGEIWKENFKITSSQTIRIVLQEPGKLQGPMLTQTYLIGDSSQLPIVSLVTDYQHFTDPDYGFFNFPMLEDVEVPAHVEFFPTNEDSGFAQNAGLKLFGGICRKYPKQSFTLLANRKFGSGAIDYPLFSDRKYTTFDGLVLRADPTPGRFDEVKVVGERLKNELIHTINQKMGGKVDMPSWRPVSLYINGQYWGIYTLMERKGKDFIRSLHGVTRADIIDEASLIVVNGSADGFEGMKAYMNENDIADPAVADSVGQLLDLNNYFDYVILQIYAGANDHDDNTRFWRPQVPDGKWRFICYDMDSWGKAEENTLFRFSRWDEAYDVDLLGRLVRNPDLRDRFVLRFTEFLNFALRPPSIHSSLEKIHAQIAEDLPRDRARWQTLMNYGNPGWQFEYLKEYAVERYLHLWEHLKQNFLLDPPQSLHLDIGEEKTGTIRLNQMMITEFPWEGAYFPKIPIELEALPSEGYDFIGWEGQPGYKEAVVRISLENPTGFRAIFRKK